MITIIVQAPTARKRGQHVVDQMQVMIDRVAISDVLHRYATALDSRRWDLLDEVFVPDAIAEYAPATGTCHGLASIKMLVSRALRGLDASQHIISNVVVQIDGDSALTRCYLHAQHYLVMPGDDGNTYEVGGTYHDVFVRTNVGWRIRHRRLEVTWIQGNRGVREESLRRAASAG